ncbi:MAG TPA: pyruvate dehydrogenase (acetyl-transferring) E1 component subunit alpha, partial [Clostridiales bacterium]|nr:pyruvate dehydrogenase (acetyl-transferring) E1 component subunit alpha [Clostridiales bacterium]
ASKLKQDESVSVCFFGDGAANQGMLSESLNLSKAWDLPVIFVCENNLYHEFSPSSHVTAGKVADRALPFGVPGNEVDGMDVNAVYEVAGEAIKRARSGGGPSLIVANTYRYEAHDQGEFALIGTTYRTEDEVSEWMSRDPIIQFENWIISENLKTETEIIDIRQKITDEIDQAVQFADSSPWPEPHEAFDHVFSN